MFKTFGLPNVRGIFCFYNVGFWKANGPSLCASFLDDGFVLGTWSHSAYPSPCFPSPRVLQGPMLVERPCGGPRWCVAPDEFGGWLHACS